ncbi:hypothetical protein EST38_g3553 [Candolleomyces aberdarensis]|uniref:Transcription factor TFIIIC triple barrel domain-containing protein n=1 Tax=Candolleomyces aberdarensis TaxID=2316362 RepID=A0A4Q2DT83_9AGAR|nr:hypothetical protein EST38_g3553 [Candolleomyces aberdarensis]
MQTDQVLQGLDSPTPFLQLQGTVLKGHHHHLLGTELIFSEDKEHHKRTIQHAANSEQRILFKEITLQQKSPPPSPKSREKQLDTVDNLDLADNPPRAMNVDEDGQRIDRMTGKSAPLTRAMRTKGTVKKKPSEASPKSSISKKGMGKVDSDHALASDVDAPDDMDTT